MAQTCFQTPENRLDESCIPNGRREGEAGGGGTAAASKRSETFGFHLITKQQQQERESQRANSEENSSLEAAGARHSGQPPAPSPGSCDVGGEHAGSAPPCHVSHATCARAAARPTGQHEIQWEHPILGGRCRVWVLLGTTGVAQGLLVPPRSPIPGRGSPVPLSTHTASTYKHPAGSFQAGSGQEGAGGVQDLTWL